MSSFSLLNLGASDFYLWLKVLTSGIALQIVGYVLELLDHTDKLHARIASLLWIQASILNLVNIVVILVQVFASSTHSNVFYYNAIPLAIYFNTFPIVAWLSFKRAGPFKSAVFSEQWYIRLSLFTKLGIFWVGISTFRGLSEDRGFVPRTSNVNWDSVRLTASYFPLTLIVIEAIKDGMKHVRGPPEVVVLNHKQLTTLEVGKQLGNPLEQPKKTKWLVVGGGSSARF